MATNDKAGALHIIAKETLTPKHEIAIEKCEPGMQIAETIHNEQGVVIIIEKTVLSLSSIQRLENLGYRKVKIFAPANQIEPTSSSYEFLYQSCLQNINDIYDTIQSGKKLKAELISSAANAVCDSAVNGSDFFQQTYRLIPSAGALQIHCLNTAMLAAYLHNWMKIGSDLLHLVVQSALLHDIGKIKISEKYHYESSTYTEQEKKLWQIHPRLGWEMVSKVTGIPSRVATIVDMHHERDDGTGFPMKLKRSSIDPLARIVSVASRFDNLTTGTNQTRSVSPFVAFAIMEEDAHSGINVEETLCFLSQVPGYYVGDRFFLSNGEIGEVLYINQHNISRPLVKACNRFIDLSLENSIHIAGMV